MQEDPRVTRILQEAVDHVRTDGAAPAATPAPAAKPADDLTPPDFLKRTATAPATNGTQPTPPVTKTVAEVTAKPDPQQAEIEALKAKLAALQGGEGVTPVVKRTRNKAATPTVAPPSPAPTPEPVAATPAAPAEPAPPASASEALQSIENELDNLL
jgi:hypothetical protein